MGAPGYQSWQWTQQDWRSILLRKNRDSTPLKKGQYNKDLDWSHKCGAKGTRLSGDRPPLCLPIHAIRELNKTKQGRSILLKQVKKKVKAKKGQRVPYPPEIAELVREANEMTPKDKPSKAKRNPSRDERMRLLYRQLHASSGERYARLLTELARELQRVGYLRADMEPSEVSLGEIQDAIDAYFDEAEHERTLQRRYRDNPFGLSGTELVGKLIGWTASGAAAELVTNRIDKWITQPVTDLAEGAITKAGEGAVGAARDAAGAARKLVKANPSRTKRWGAARPYLSLAEVRKWEPLAEERGVSEVARKGSSKVTGEGFLQAYKAVKGKKSALKKRKATAKTSWWDRRGEFIARHVTQMEESGRPFWEWSAKRGAWIPTRQHLGLIMWAYLHEPPPRDGRPVWPARGNPARSDYQAWIAKNLSDRLLDVWEGLHTDPDRYAQYAGADLRRLLSRTDDLYVQSGHQEELRGPLSAVVSAVHQIENGHIEEAKASVDYAMASIEEFADNWPPRPYQRSGPPRQMNPDDRFARAEREFQESPTPEAEANLLRERLRIGEADKGRVLTQAANKDEVARLALGLEPGDAEVLKVAGRKKKVTTDLGADLISAYYLGRGWTRDQWGGLRHPDGNRRIKFKKRSYELLKGKPGNWHKASGGSMKKRGEELLAAARQRYEGGGAVERLEEKRAKTKKRAKKRRETKQDRSNALRAELVTAFRRMAPGVRRELLEGNVALSREVLVDALGRANDRSTDLTPEQIDASLSAGAPPVLFSDRVFDRSFDALRAELGKEGRKYVLRPVENPKEYSWRDAESGLEISMRSGWGQESVVEIGYLPMDPFSGAIVAGRFGGRGASERGGGLVARLGKSLVLYDVIFSDLNELRALLRTWCRMVHAFGHEHFVLGRLGAEAAEALRTLYEGGEIYLSKLGANIIVRCGRLLDDPRQAYLF